MAPRVTVIVPTYNRSEYLAEALGSALAQDFDGLEILVTDNSDDTSVRDLVDELADARISYRHNGENVGPTLNALNAYREASGRFVTMLHDDDRWEPGFLETLVPPLEADGDLILSFCDHYIIDAVGAIDLDRTEQWTTWSHRRGLSPGVHRPFHQIAVVHAGINMVCGAVVRNGVLPVWEMPKDIYPLYDIWLAYLASRTKRGAWYTPQRLSSYRRHGSALSSTVGHAHQELRAYEHFLDDPAMRDVRWGLRRRCARFGANAGAALLRQGDTDAARAALLTSLRRYPSARSVETLARSVVGLEAVDTPIDVRVRRTLSRAARRLPGRRVRRAHDPSSRR